MARRTKKGNKATINVDLSNVQEGAKSIPEGSYVVSVVKTEIKKSNNSGSDYIAIEFEVIEGKHKGAKLFHNCSLQPQALFNLKAVLAALGFDIPGKAFDLDINDMVGLECEVEVADEKYEGKTKSRIVDFLTSDSEDGEEEEDEDEEEEEDEEDEEDEEEDYSEMSLKELKAECKERGIKVKKGMKKPAIIELLEEDDEE